MAMYSLAHNIRSQGRASGQWAIKCKDTASNWTDGDRVVVVW